MKIKKSIIVIIVVLLAVIALSVIFRLRTENKNAADNAQASTSNVFTVRTEEAERRTLQAYLEVNANIVSGHQVAVLPDAGGRVASMNVTLGSRVQRGAVLAQIDPSRPGTEFMYSTVYAPVSGTVVSSPQPVGSTVSTGTSLMIIAVNDSIEIEALIPEREVGQLTTGLKAQVRLEAFPGEVFNATLTQISPVVDPVSRTKKVIMRFDSQDPRINAGMFARIKLNTRTYENVVSIPQEALVEHRGRTIVFVMNTNPDSNYASEPGVRGVPEGTLNEPEGSNQGFGSFQSTPRVEMREVITGANVDREVEIKSGLNPGEAVVVQGQQFLTDGAPVRVIGRRI